MVVLSANEKPIGCIRVEDAVLSNDFEPCCTAFWGTRHLADPRMHAVDKTDITYHGI